MIKQLLSSTFKKKIKTKLGVPDTFDSVKRLKLLGFNPSTIIDIGAYEGYWTEEMLTLFPNARFFMVEAQSSKEEFLKKCVVAHGNNIKYSMSLLGATEGEKVFFNEYETASSVLTEHFDTNAVKTEKTIQTLDNLLQKNNITSADFIKLDTQGYELEILKGASNTLLKASLVQMEVSFMDIYKNVPLINDTLKFMSERGFVVYEIGSLIRRPLDNALYQADLLFVREDSVLRSDKRWNK